MSETNGHTMTTALKLFRLSREVTQTGLARETHIPASEIGYIEQGRLIPTEVQLERLETFFGVPGQTLLRRVDLHELIAKI
jgi:transcriptional regulator with XRE-family HTH domain